MRIFKLFGTQVGVLGPQEGYATFEAALSVQVTRGSNYKPKTFRESLRRYRNLLLRGDMDNYGVVGRKSFTKWAAYAMVNALKEYNAQFTWDTGLTFKFQDATTDLFGIGSAFVWQGQFGTGTNAESVSDKNLQTPSTGGMTGRYDDYPDTSGMTNTQPVYAKVSTNRATLTFISDSGPLGTNDGPFGGGYMAITEFIVKAHQLDDASFTPNYLPIDRTVFSAINLTSGDAIKFTYVLTFTAGG
jgi:hypothetical protein